MNKTLNDISDKLKKFRDKLLKTQDGVNAEPDGNESEKEIMRRHGELLKEETSFNEGGQWDIKKSSYGPKGMGLYNPNDNAERKKTNTGESMDNIGQNKNVKQYARSGSSVEAARAKNVAKEQRAKTKASTKIYTEEEKKQLMEERK